ncbi:hypothetical protein Tco_0297633, partial [Tanacetum coccineum]
DTQVEFQGIELGNIPQSYAVPTTPYTRIHKDHPIEHVIGDEEPKRVVSKSLSDPAWVEAMQEELLQFKLQKYNYTDVKSASTPTDLEKPLVQDGDAADVDCRIVIP